MPQQLSALCSKKAVFNYLAHVETVFSSEEDFLQFIQYQILTTTLSDKWMLLYRRQIRDERKP